MRWPLPASKDRPGRRTTGGLLPPAGAVALMGALLGGCAGGGGSPPLVTLDPLRVSAPSPSLGGAAFLVGCWRSPPDADVVVEERWSPPADGVMLGTSRTFRGGRMTSFEFAVLREERGKVTLLPYPEGVASEHSFDLVDVSAHHLRFEAPAHDYPTRIHYRRTPAGLEARIDGGPDDPHPRSWQMAPVRCSGVG